MSASEIDGLGLVGAGGAAVSIGTAAGTAAYTWGRLSKVEEKLGSMETARKEAQEALRQEAEASEGRLLAAVAGLHTARQEDKEELLAAVAGRHTARKEDKEELRQEAAASEGRLRQEAAAMEERLAARQNEAQGPLLTLAGRAVSALERNNVQPLPGLPQAAPQVPSVLGGRAGGWVLRRGPAPHCGLQPRGQCLPCGDTARLNLRGSASTTD